jgi:hypothetical protein
MIDYHDYVGEDAKITDKDGKIIEGRIIGYEVGAMEDKEYDSIDVAKIGEGYSIEVPIPNIKKIEIIKER